MIPIKELNLSYEVLDKESLESVIFELKKN